MTFWRTSLSVRAGESASADADTSVKLSVITAASFFMILRTFEWLDVAIKGSRGIALPASLFIMTIDGL
jgi:hypothetical protein